MDLEQLQKEAEKDLKINNEQLDIESLKTPELYAKYLKIYTRWSLLSKQAESDCPKIIKGQIFFKSLPNTLLSKISFLAFIQLTFPLTVFISPL